MHQCRCAHADCEIRKAMRTQQLEHAYKEYLKEITILHDTEIKRRLRTKIVFLEQDNDDLRDQAWEHETQIDELYISKDGLSEELATANKSLEGMRLDLGSKTRHMDSLTAELHSMKGVTSNSSKLLSEKLALSRELSALKPQMEHLQAQLAANQNTLAEKLSLQRELSAVQVELENEKRSSDNVHANREKASKREEKLEEQIKALKSELAKEKDRAQEVETERQKALDESEGKITLLETRLNACRTELKTTKEQLQDYGPRSAARQSTVSVATTLRESTDNTTGTIPTFRKRTLAQMDPDAAVGTPGDLPKNKRGKRSSTLPGEKSTFSITPFLNKAGNVAADDNDDTPSRPTEGRKAAPSVEEQPEDKTQKVSRKKNTVIQTKTNDGPSHSEDSAATVKAKLKPQRSTASLARKSNLDQVLEENDENEERPQSKASEDATVPIARQTFTGPEKPVFKKKRKLLGKTLFDDDDDTVTRIDEGLFSAKKSLSSLGRPSGGRASMKFGPRPSMAAPGSAFGSFSPLKRERSLLAA